MITDNDGSRVAVLDIVGAYACEVDRTASRDILLRRMVTKFLEMSRGSQITLEIANRENFLAIEYAIS